MNHKNTTALNKKGFFLFSFMHRFSAYTKNILQCHLKIKNAESVSDNCSLD